MPEKKKVFDVFAVEEGSNNQTYWRNVGVAFQNRDDSFNIKLYMFPGLQLQLRERQERQDKQQ